MGDPRKTRSKYQGPRHPWNKQRIEDERILVKNYGLTNKKELWKVDSKLKNFKDTIKRLIAQTDSQADIERKQLFDRLQSLGVVGADATADTVLGLSVEKLLDRRLQTVVVKKGFARSSKQARQFITHGHVVVGDQKLTSPGHIVTVAQEAQIEFKPTSSLSKADHPERVILEKASKRGKSKEALDQEELPVTKTVESSSDDKTVEEKIEADTTDKKEVDAVVETLEADAIAADHKKEVTDKAVKDDVSDKKSDKKKSAEKKSSEKKEDEPVPKKEKKSDVKEEKKSEPKAESTDSAEDKK